MLNRKWVFTPWGDTLFDLYEIVLPGERTCAATSLIDKDGTSAWGEMTESIRRSARFVVEYFDGPGLLRSKWSVDTAYDWLYPRMSFTTWHLIVHELGWTREEVIARTVESVETDMTTLGKSD